MEISFATSATIVIMSTVSGWLANILMSYFSEKGKNAATKEDIGKITQIVEEVKQQFTHDSEVLKNRLGVYSQNFVTIKTLERDALINVAKAFSDWLTSLEGFNLVFYNYDDYEPLKKNSWFFEEKRLAFINARDHLYLFMHDEELRNRISILNKGAVNVEGCIATYITKFILNCKNRNNDCTGKSDNEILDITTKYHAAQETVIAEQLAERNKLIMSFYNEYITFLKMIGHRINTLIS